VIAALAIAMAGIALAVTAIGVGLRRATRR